MAASIHAAQPPASTETFVDLDGARVRILTSAGTGSPLLVLHGGGTDNAASSWYEPFATLGTEHALHALDLPDSVPQKASRRSGAGGDGRPRGGGCARA